MNEVLSIEERINNVVDELERAITRLKELGDFSDDTLTDDEILVDDMTASLERIKEINDIIGLALIIAANVGHEIYEHDLMKETNCEIEPDSVKMRKNYLKWATELLPKCQEDKWEDYYDTAWRKGTEELNKVIQDYYSKIDSIKAWSGTTVIF